MRRAGAAKREILPDPKYGSRIVAKFVNMMMYGGKKSTAEKIMYEAMGAMEDRAKQDALKLFKAAVDNCKPGGGGQVATGGRLDIPGAGRGATRPADGPQHALADRGRAAPRGEEHVGAGSRVSCWTRPTTAGRPSKKREDTHKMAEANKAFAHYRW